MSVLTDTGLSTSVSATPKKKMINTLPSFRRQIRFSRKANTGLTQPMEIRRTVKKIQEDVLEEAMTQMKTQKRQNFSAPFRGPRLVKTSLVSKMKESDPSKFENQKPEKRTVHDTKTDLGKPPNWKIKR